VTKDELYPIIDEVLHERSHPYTDGGSAWLYRNYDEVELRIHELAEALCDAIVGRMAVVSGDMVERLRNHSKRSVGCDCVRCEAATEIINLRQWKLEEARRER
jgi:hypothetical protein